MATYRQIHITYWQDPFVEDLKPLHKYFYLYLLTNSKTTQCGCYEISDKLIKYETGLEQKQIDEMLKHFADSKKIVFNKPNNEILLLNWLKHNSFKSPKVKACIERELISIKTSNFKEFIQNIINNRMGIDRLSIDYGYTIDTQSQKEEEKEEEEKENKKEITLGRFDEFWTIYPKKVAKDKALQYFSKLTDVDIDAIVADVKVKCNSTEWIKDNGQYIPHPTTYLNQRRWNDVLEVVPQQTNRNRGIEPAADISPNKVVKW